MCRFFGNKRKDYIVETEELPSASELRKISKTQYISREDILKGLNEAAKSNKCSESFEGYITEELEEELKSKGYDVYQYISYFDYYCTKISWSHSLRHSCED